MAVNNLIILRKGTASQWNSANPVLASGEPGYDLTNQILKVGDGVTAWNSLSNHSHSASNISDFNSSVSGLFPVKSIIAGSNITISSTSGTYTINSTASGGGGSATSISNYGSNRVLLSDNTSTGISAQTNLTFNGSTLSAPNGSFSTALTVNSVNVSVSGHNHIIGDVTGLQSALDSKQATGSYAASSHTHTASQVTDFNSSVSGLINGIYAPLSSPTFTGVPLTPTASSGTNTNQIASTSFVRTEISNLVASAPSTLDTLNELATALGNDANFSTTIASGLGTKAALSGSTFTGNISAPSGSFTSLSVSGIPLLNRGYYYEIHVSQVDGNDTTGNGDLLNPVASITKALTLVGSQRKTIIVHPGTYTENPSITVQYTTITGPGLIGGNIVLSGTLSTNTGCTIAGIKMTNLTIATPTGAGNVNILNCEISGTLTKSSNADYTVLRLCDYGSASITGAGLVAIFGGNPNFTTVNNASANIIIKSAVTVAPVLTSGTLSLVDSIVVAAVTNAITSASSSIITLANCQMLTSALSSVAPVVLSGFYSILNCVYDKTNSTLVALSATGGSTNSIDYFQYINADKFITQGGTSSDYVKGDGSLGLLPNTIVYTTGNQAISGVKTFSDLPFVNGTGISISGHNHITSNITDFNTSVSGLVNGVYAPLASPTFTGTVNGITKSMVGLGNVDNTSDASKPISSATQTALDNKAAISHTHTSSNITDFNSSVSGLVSNYALLNSPTLTGTPLSPTAAVDTNTTQIASTAFVLGQASSSTPLIDGTATIGTSTRYARADHIHPTDTTRAALTGATFTGSISSPSGNFTQSLQVNSTGVSLVGHTHTSSQISDSTTAGRALLTGADAAAQRTSLGLGTLATQNGTFSGTSSGTNTGDQTISISGDVTAAGSSSSLNATVTKINGVLLAGLSTGLIKNTISTGAPSIAIAGTDYAAASHTHTSSNITDFNSSVSGLLPVLNIVAGSGVTISSTSGTYTLNATGSSSIPTNVTNSANLYLWSSFR